MTRCQESDQVQEQAQLHEEKHDIWAVAILLMCGNPQLNFIVGKVFLYESQDEELLEYRKSVEK